MFQFRLRTLLSLKVSVVVGFVVIWNVYFLTVSYLHHGGPFLKGPVTPSIAAAFIPLYLAATVGAFSVAVLPSVQKFAVAPSRRHNFRKAEFVLIGALLSIFVILFGLTALRVVSFVPDSG